MSLGVVTHSNGVERYFQDRSDAVAWFEKAAEFSSGEELAGYRRILRELDDGHLYVTDNEMFLQFRPFLKYCSSCHRNVLGTVWSHTCACCGQRFCFNDAVTRK